MLLSVDPSLGRVDYGLFSDQTLMEMLLEGFDDETKKTYKDNDGMYLDVCEWSCVTCDDNQRVTEVDIDSSNIVGSLELCYAPPKVKEFRVNPPWDGSKMTGSVDLTHLPEEMTHLDLQNNQLTGEVDLTQLPKGMKQLDLQSNNLTGEIILTHLPDGMNGLFLYNNQLTGEIDLTCLPGGMECLFLRNNQLSGSVVIQRLPQGMRMIELRENHFNASAVVDSKATDVDIFLSGSGVTSVVDENGKKVDMKRFPK